MARKAGTDDAQWMPRLLYICEVKSGKAAPNTDRMIPLPAKTDAAKMV